MNFHVKAPEGMEENDKKGLGVVSDFENKKDMRASFLKDALVSRFPLLTQDLIAPKKGKFEVSSELKTDHLLKRMIVDNPYDIVHSYAERFLRFNAETPKSDFEQFIEELGHMKEDAIKIMVKAKEKIEDPSLIQPMDQFVGYLDLMIAAARSFAGMSDEARKKALSGEKDGLSDGDKYALQMKAEVEIVKNKVFKKAQLKEEKMKATDRRMREVLDAMYAEEVAKEKAAKGEDKKKKPVKTEKSDGGKVLRFKRKKSQGEKRAKKGESIERMQEAA